MKKLFVALFTAIVILVLASISYAFGGTLLQDFESAQSISDTFKATGEISTEKYHNGSHSLKMVGSELWAKVTAPLDNEVDLDPGKQDNKVTFWVYAVPTDGNAHNMAMVFGDDKGKQAEVWTGSTSAGLYAPNQWKQLIVKLPTNVDIHHITKIGFKVYNPGTFYLDDVIAEQVEIPTVTTKQLSSSTTGKFELMYRTDLEKVTRNDYDFNCEIGTKATNGNSWAQVVYKMSKYSTGNYDNGSITNGVRYRLGMDKVGGSLDWSFSTADDDYCGIGQRPLNRDDFSDGDPMFAYWNKNSLRANWETGLFSLRVEDQIYKSYADGSDTGETGHMPYTLNLISKTGNLWIFKQTQVYAGYHVEYSELSSGEYNTINESIFGGRFVLGSDLKVKWDYFMFKSTDAVDKTLLDSNNEFQVNLAKGNFNTTFFYTENVDADTNVYGYGAEYKFRKLTPGFRYFTGNEEGYEVYGTYDLGAFYLKFGYRDPWEDNNEKYSYIGFRYSL